VNHLRKQKSNHSATPKRRREILLAALACFTESGVAGTNIGDVCERARASVGSVYHHFKSKAGLAAGLYFEGIRDYQEGLTAELAKHVSAEKGIRAMVRYHLAWVGKNRDWARFLFHERHADYMARTGEEFRKLNAEFIGEMGAWIAGRVISGEIRPIQPDLFACVILGPCQEYSRVYLSGHFMTPMDRAVREIGDAVWHAVRAPERSGGA